MALETALEIAKRAADELGLARPSVLAGQTTGFAPQFLALLNAGGREFMRIHQWGDLVTLGTITTVADQSDYAVPDDFNRMVADTSWDRTTDRRMWGPDSPQRDRWRRESGLSTSSIDRHFRLIGNSYIRVFPTPTAAGETIVYEYVSSKWAASSTGTAQYEFEADGDTCIFDPDLMVKDLKYRFLLAKGLPSSEVMKAERDAALASWIGADLGGTTLSLTNRSRRQAGDVFGSEISNIILTDDGDYLETD